MSNFVPDSGPITAQTLIIGEAPGRDEDRRRRPFLGRAGMRLTEFTKAAKVDRIKELRITNTYPFQPPNNNLSLIPVAEREKHLQTLHGLIRRMPNLRLIVPMGAYALNAVLPERPSTITNLRGSIYPKGKHLILPMVHPALTLYEDTWTRAAIHDWKRARLLMDDPSAYKPLTREHEIMPSLSRLREYLRECRSLGKKDCLAIDIETPVKTGRQMVGYFKNGKPRWQKTKGARFIACIGFSSSKLHSLTIPLTRAYWGRSVGDVWDLVEEICATKVDKVFHNGMFDTWHLDRVGIWVRNWKWDTKDLHHALDPWDKHSLGYCASVDTWEPFWKDEGKSEGKGIPLDLEKYWTYCVDEHSRVLTDDFRWVKIKQLQVGQEIIAPDEHGGVQSRGEKSRRWRLARVEAVYDQGEKECLRITTKSGRSIVCTPEHKLLVANSYKRCWREAGELQVGWSLSEGLEPWDEPEDSTDAFDQGWLGGFLDGEGTLAGIKALDRCKDGGRGYMSFAQKPGKLYNRAKRIFERYGFSLTKPCRIGAVGSAQCGYVKGGNRSAMRAVGMFRPERLLRGMRRLLRAGCIRAVCLKNDPIVDIREVGLRRVFDITTSTGTFLVDGYIVHNCGKDAAVTRELWWKYKVRLSKIEIREPQAQDWWETAA